MLGRSVVVEGFHDGKWGVKVGGSGGGVFWEGVGEASGGGGEDMGAEEEVGGGGGRDLMVMMGMGLVLIMGGERKT